MEPTNSEAAGMSTGLRVHTPDQRKYHRLPEHPNVITIARSDINGRPLGFAHDKPGDVRVVRGGKPSPEFPSVVVPLSAVGNGEWLKNLAHQAAAVGSTPFDVYRELAHMIPEIAPQPDPHLATPAPSPARAAMTVAVPSRAATPSQGPVPYAPALGGLEPHPPAPSAYPPAAVYAAPVAAAATDPTLHALRALTEQVQALVAAQAARPAVPDVARPWEHNESARAKQSGVAGLDFVGADGPLRPAVEVSVDLGPAGRMKTWCHKVVATAEMVLLIFDGRHEGTPTWEPPVDPQRVFVVDVPSLNLKAPCVYAGMCCDVGQLKLTIFMRDEGV